MTLQEKIDQMKAQVESRIPPEALAVMHRETETLINSGKTDNVIKKGEALPKFSLLNHNGEGVSSKALVEKGPVVVSFYRGVW
ncbi:MAG: hypothetical protein MI892_07700 [Desulfobacterales bacterium]|nr:hypothetical protein [Desulfobacterales bacterium]